MQEKVITHNGIVTKIQNGEIFVTIESESACVSCHAKGACSMSDKTDKIVNVDAKNYPKVRVGDNVTVLITKENGIFAVIISYIIPIVLIILSLFISKELNVSEPMSLLYMFILLTLYFTIIYLSRKKIKNKINIQIKI